MLQLSPFCSFSSGNFFFLHFFHVRFFFFFLLLFASLCSVEISMHMHGAKRFVTSMAINSTYILIVSRNRAE